MGRAAASQILPDQVARILERLGQERIPQMEADLNRGLHRTMRRYVLEMSPVGDRPKRRDGKEVGPGEYKRSHVSSVGRPGGPDSPAALDTMGGGETSYLASTAPHGRALEYGLTPARTHRGDTWYERVVGSTQAPKGIYFPARRRLRQVQTEIAGEVIKKHERAIERGA